MNACLLMGWLANRDWSGIDRTFPAIRVVTLVAYGAAATSKWNTAFLDPSESCAVFIADKAMFGGLSSVPLGAEVAVVVAVGAETLIFLALLVPSTRRFGAAFGIFFHSLVSLSPAIAVSDFSAALFALFVLFPPQEQFELGQSVITRFASESLLFAPFRRHPGLRPIAAWTTLPLGNGLADGVGQGGALVVVPGLRLRDEPRGVGIAQGEDRVVGASWARRPQIRRRGGWACVRRGGTVHRSQHRRGLHHVFESQDGRRRDATTFFCQVFIWWIYRTSSSDRPRRTRSHGRSSSTSESQQRRPLCVVRFTMIETWSWQEFSTAGRQ